MIYLENHAAHICHLSATINHTKSVNQPAMYLGVGCGRRKEEVEEKEEMKMKMMTHYCMGCFYCWPTCKFWNYCRAPHLRHRHLPKKYNGKLDWWKLSAISMKPTQFNYHIATLHRTVLCDARQHYTIVWLSLLNVTIMKGWLAVLHYYPQGNKKLLSVGTNIWLGYTPCLRVAPWALQFRVHLKTCWGWGGATEK